MKVMKFDFDDRTFVFKKEPLALLEANRRAAVDNNVTDKNIMEEFKFLMEDNYDLYDFMRNSMDWADVVPFLIRVENETMSDVEKWHDYKSDVEWFDGEEDDTS